MNQKPKTKPQAIKKELPYKKSRVSTNVAENVENATAKFIAGSPQKTNKYEMILVATARSRDLHRGAPTTITGDHRPLVTALLEIEAGEIGWSYGKN